MLKPSCSSTGLRRILLPLLADSESGGRHLLQVAAALPSYHGISQMTLIYRFYPPMMHAIELARDGFLGVAINQLRGGFSNELKTLRSKLLEMSSLMELELDFSEEDVEFADRSQLKALLQETLDKVNKLKDSFRLGNAIKNGIPVAIVGQTNTGKSTLLNALLDEDRAIVSDIAGTTRDTIEETLNIDGTLFRFIDTAGIRDTDETIEKIGIERSYKKISEANIVIGMLDATNDYDSVLSAANDIRSKVDLEHQQLLLCINKVDTLNDQGKALLGKLRLDLDNDGIIILCLSAKHGLGLNDMYDNLARIVTSSEIPLGILTSFVGAPVFVWLILQGGADRER